MNLTVNTKQAKEFLITNIKAGLVTMLHGDPGIKQKPKKEGL